MHSKFAYCPICMYRERIRKGTKASDYICPRHGVRCIYSGEQHLFLINRKQY